MVLSGLQKWYGTYYYFDPSTYEKVTNKWINNVYFNETGSGEEHTNERYGFTIDLGIFLIHSRRPIEVVK
ncbi:hypothetical protein FC35_GL000012 [Limosilactobacillus coleohominis DSM 14060]|nr:hypothetical protein FC35_GL000012 [Limosilactobacillus coleohominis DSM 14060]